MATRRETEILPAVAAMIFNERGDVLLQKRKDVEKWCVISGHVEFGETVEEAILREIQEEINVPAEIVRLIGVYSTPSFTTYHYDDRVVQYVISYFEVKLLELPDETLTNEETLAIRFFPVTEIPHDLDMMNPHWLEDALEKNARPFVR